jgi:hypothetical protein
VHLVFNLSQSSNCLGQTPCKVFAPSLPWHVQDLRDKLEKEKQDRRVEMEKERQDHERDVKSLSTQLDKERAHRKEDVEALRRVSLHVHVCLLSS